MSGDVRNRLLVHFDLQHSATRLLPAFGSCFGTDSLVLLWKKTVMPKRVLFSVPIQTGCVCVQFS